MKLTIAIDPSKSGRIRNCLGEKLLSINLHTLGEDFEFVEHIQDLKDHPDVTEIEAVIELVPPLRAEIYQALSGLSSARVAGSWKALCVWRRSRLP